MISTVCVSALVKSTSFKMSTGEIIKNQSQTKQSGSTRKIRPSLFSFSILMKRIFSRSEPWTHLCEIILVAFHQQTYFLSLYFSPFPLPVSPDRGQKQQVYHTRPSTGTPRLYTGGRDHWWNQITQFYILPNRWIMF